MRIVLDTNILLVAISDRSPFHLIFRRFMEGAYTLCVTTEILNEYDEIIAVHATPALASAALETIENAQNALFITRYFAFDLIKVDPDDNKFVDCAIASNADFIVTNDGHFNVLSQIPFPRVTVLNVDAFMERLRGLPTTASPAQ